MQTARAVTQFVNKSQQSQEGCIACIAIPLIVVMQAMHPSCDSSQILLLVISQRQAHSDCEWCVLFLHCCVWCDDLCRQEMNTPTAGRTLTQHRKIAVHFRDAALLKTFTTALAALQQLHAKGADAKLKQEVGSKTRGITLMHPFNPKGPWCLSTGAEFGQEHHVGADRASAEG